MIFLTGKDALTDFIPSWDSVQWGSYAALAFGAAGFGFGFAVGGPIAGYELMQFAAEGGFESAMAIHEFAEDIVSRGSALVSLWEHNWDSPDPTVSPSPMPNSVPDMRTDFQVILK